MEERDETIGALRRELAVQEVRLRTLERGAVTALAVVSAAALVLGSVMPWIVDEKTDTWGGTTSSTYRLGIFALQVVTDHDIGGDDLTVLFGISFAVFALTTFAAVLVLGGLATASAVGPVVRGVLTTFLVCCGLGATLVTLSPMMHDADAVHWSALLVWGAGAVLAMTLMHAETLRAWSQPSA